MKKRLFIAINPPEEFKDTVENELEQVRYQFTNDVRFLHRDDWNITITFLGYQEDSALIPILESLKEACAGFSPQNLVFSKIEYGPTNDSPRMIWLTGTPETSKIIWEFKKNLNDALYARGVIFKESGFRAFTAHITLGRFPAFPKEQLPDISKSINLHFTAETAALMESHLQRSGAHYQLLQQENFKL